MKKIETVELEEYFFEDFTDGQILPSATKGPMMVGHQVRWAGACDNYDAEFHHDEYVAKAQGLPGIILSGPLIGSYLITEVGRWFGRHARIVTFWDRNTGSTMPRDLVHLQGRIKRKFEEDGEARIEIECWAVNQNEVVTTPAGAVVALPRRAPRG
jgi:hydroxyacyl-ACP dehydratase HTD2-like protein with hotdog domain